MVAYLRTSGERIAAGGAGCDIAKRQPHQTERDPAALVAAVRRGRIQTADNSMIPKSGNRFSEKIMLNQEAKA
jgi:hypothetical protein